MSMDVNTIKAPEPGQSLSAYQQFLIDIKTDADVFERKLGRISWLQGSALIEARKVCKRKEWSKLLGTISMKPTTAKYLRRIAEVITETESHTMSYSDMLKRCYPSFTNAVKKDLADEDGNNETVGTTPRFGNPATVSAEQTVKILTICRERLRGTANGPDLPDDTDENKLGNIGILLREIESEVCRVKDAIDGWAKAINGKVAA